MYGKVNIVRNTDISSKDPELSKIPEDDNNILVHIEHVNPCTISISKGSDGVGFFPVEFYSIEGDLSNEQIEENKNAMISILKKYRKKGYSIWVVDIAYKRLSELGINLKKATEKINWLKYILSASAGFILSLFVIVFFNIQDEISCYFVIGFGIFFGIGVANERERNYLIDFFASAGGYKNSK